MFGLGTVLLISSLSGRYGLAGAVAAAGATGYALVSPLVARLADRAGQRAVLRPLMVVFAAATAGLIIGAQARAPAGVLLAASGLAGAATPQLVSMVRARWSMLLAVNGYPGSNVGADYDSCGEKRCSDDGAHADVSGDNDGCVVRRLIDIEDRDRCCACADD
jgi:MFS family permease